mgnify:CR=1 FL=1
MNGSPSDRTATPDSDIPYCLAAVPPSMPTASNGAVSLYYETDGDGNVTFNDAVVLSFVDATQLNSEQVAAVDFDGDGDLDIDDAVALAFE